MKTMIWFGRKFDFDLPAEMYPMIIERLRGTPIRLEEKTKSLPPGILTRRQGQSWSVLESVGHLLDVEPLWEGRIDDFLAGEKRLRPADLQNRKTHEANHNATPIEILLTSFRTSREHLVNRFDAFQGEDVVQSALHPRLDQEMRIIDLAFFIAEHDDHHLARTTELIRLFGQEYI